MDGVGYVHGIMHIGLGVEFKQPAILAEGLAEAAVHHDWFYTDYIEACAAAARKEGPKRSLMECFDEAMKDEKITSCSSFDYCRQYQPPSEEFPEGRWFVTREPYRDGVVGLVKKELAGVAGAWQVTYEDDLERATAELINISSTANPIANTFLEHSNTQCDQFTSPPVPRGHLTSLDMISSSSTAQMHASGTPSS